MDALLEKKESEVVPLIKRQKKKGEFIVDKEKNTFDDHHRIDFMNAVYTEQLNNTLNIWHMQHSMQDHLYQ